MLSRNTGRFLLAFACVATALATAAHAQTDATVSMAVPDQHEAVRLDSFVVSASRTLQDPRYVSSSVSVLPLDDLQAAQITDLHTALAQVPGVTVASYGGAGSQSAAPASRASWLDRMASSMDWREKPATSVPKWLLPLAIG